MGFIPDQLNLVEVELLDSCPKIARVNKSLVGCRIKHGKLNVSREEIVADARAYWSRVTQTTFDEEILSLANTDSPMLFANRSHLFVQR
jgi:hypothetical protein